MRKRSSNWTLSLHQYSWITQERPLRILSAKVMRTAALGPNAGTSVAADDPYGGAALGIPFFSQCPDLLFNSNVLL